MRMHLARELYWHRARYHHGPVNLAALARWHELHPGHPRARRVAWAAVLLLVLLVIVVAVTSGGATGV